MYCYTFTNLTEFHARKGTNLICICRWLRAHLDSCRTGNTGSFAEDKTAEAWCWPFIYMYINGINIDAFKNGDTFCEMRR
jgi:hypothetical protein